MWSIFVVTLFTVATAANIPTIESTYGGLDASNIVNPVIFGKYMDATMENSTESGNLAAYEKFMRQIVNEEPPLEAPEFAEPVFAFFTDNASADAKYHFEEASQLLKNPKFDNSKKTVIYIHGFLEGLFSESVKHVVETYQQTKDHNIVILDWHWYALPEYFLNAVPHVDKIGTKAASAILDMIKNGLSLERLHIVGHSLGGQMSGVIGRTVQKQSNGAIKLKRISALDPAFPGFYGFLTAEHLTKKDAEYVDVIHTDFGVYGAPVSTGTVDFWPNGGLSPQPGCLINVCSHQRSWWYWTESLITDANHQFNAIKALGWWPFKFGITGKYDPTVIMGINCPLGLSGDYYFQTNTKSPFARGQAGIKYESFLDPKASLESLNELS